MKIRADKMVLFFTPKSIWLAPKCLFKSKKRTSTFMNMPVYTAEPNIIGKIFFTFYEKFGREK